ncbi:MAG: hypothetical protein K5893_02000, partial [Prevotella sp.]|nr:hypothetical protein [Prevotella sp.]
MENLREEKMRGLKTHEVLNGSLWRLCVTALLFLAVVPAFTASVKSPDGRVRLSLKGEGFVVSSNG